MSLVTTTWEVEVELAAADYLADEDGPRFRARMERLGFEADEIDAHVDALKH